MSNFSTEPTGGRPERNQGSGCGWLVIGAVAIVGALVFVLALEWLDGGDETSGMLSACDVARAEWVRDLDPVFHDDPLFGYEDAQVPLTDVEDSYTYDTGVVQLTGTSGGRAWVCLYDAGTARWSWED